MEIPLHGRTHASYALKIIVSLSALIFFRSLSTATSVRLASGLRAGTYVLAYHHSVKSHLAACVSCAFAGSPRRD